MTIGPQHIAALRGMIAYLHDYESESNLADAKLLEEVVEHLDPTARRRPVFKKHALPRTGNVVDNVLSIRESMLCEEEQRALRRRGRS